jgi:O-Antigen ligase
LLIAALAAGTVAQGGYYLPGRILLIALVAVACALARVRPHRPLWSVPLASAALAAGILVRGLTGGGVALAVAGVATLATFAAAVVIVATAPAELRERFAEAAVWLGAAVGAAAWAGVAWRIPRFVVLVEHRLWRGAATLTYPNAAAALLAPLALLALVRLLARPADLYRVGAAYLVLVGLGATLSRAGFIAFAAGLLVLAILHKGVWRVLPILLGAVFGVAGLAPSFPYGGSPHPVPAVAGLLLGAVVAAGLTWSLERFRSVGLWSALGTVALAGLVAWAQLGASYTGKIWESRGNLESSGRSQAFTSAMDLVVRYPWTGVGIGQARFFVTGPGGHDAVALYAHDEYLQTLVDLGVIGAVLLLILLVTVVRLVRHRGDGLWAGAIAALTAFAVHSGLDFLWHIAVLPLLAGLLTGLAATGRGRPAAPSEEQPISAPRPKELQR